MEARFPYDGRYVSFTIFFSFILLNFLWFKVVVCLRCLKHQPMSTPTWPIHQVEPASTLEWWWVVLFALSCSLPFNFIVDCFQMPGMQQQPAKGVGPGFSPAPFPNNACYPGGSFSSNVALPNVANGQFPSSKSTPSFRGGPFPSQSNVPPPMACSSMPSTSTADSTLNQRFPSMELPQFPISSDSTPTLPQPQQQTPFSGTVSTPYNCGMRPSPSMCPTSPNEVSQ